MTCSRVAGTRLLTALLLLTLLPSLVTGGAAQEASPPAAACVAPPLPPGTPTPPEAVGTMGQATPASDAGAASASPEPILVEATPTGIPAAASDVRAVEQLLITWAACRRAGNSEAEAALYAEPALLQVGGTTNPWDTVAYLEAEQEPLALQAVEDVRSYPDGHFSAAITLLIDEHWRSRQFQEVRVENGMLKLGVFSFLPTPVPAGATVVDVHIGDDGLEVRQDTLPSESWVDLEVRNDGQHERGLALFRLPAGTSPAQFAEAGGDTPGTQFIGYAPSAPDAPTNIVLRDLAPGTYVLAGYIEAPGAVPQLAPGLWAGLTVSGVATPTP
jgi:hypothetical protein